MNEQESLDLILGTRNDLDSWRLRMHSVQVQEPGSLAPFGSLAALSPAAWSAAWQV
jgi:hypothetical protein